jgi:glutamyl-tRNA synthetase
MSVRTRFAPSPTGRLHLGNVRIAVFNWLFARHYDGAFILRIEDTDVERNVAGSDAALMEDLHWLGLDWDEGPDRGGPFGPYRQSQRAAFYQEAASTLLERGLAYPCYCTDEELARGVTPTSGGVVASYPGSCRRLTVDECRAHEREGRIPAIRFRLPDVETIDILDEVRGLIQFSISDFDDFVIVRRDGRPTYNFAVVVDDLAMAISHVIRGAGHLSNTPRQTLLFEALGQELPRFVHLPTVLSPTGGRLSKRTGSASLDELREQGYHPDGIVNYLSLLGWSSPDEREVLSRSELIGRIGLDRVGTSDTMYDPYKLRWLSGQHLQAMQGDDLVRASGPFVDRNRFPLPEEGVPAAIEALRSRIEVLGDVPVHLEAFLYPPEGSELDRIRSDVRSDPEAARVVDAVAHDLERLDEWSAPRLSGTVRDVGKALSVRGPALFHPVRKALTGSESGPDLGLIMAALGRAEVLRRLSWPPDREDVLDLDRV